MQLPFGALERVALRFVAQDRRWRRMEDDRAFAAIDDNLIAALDLLQEAAHPEYRGKIERARHDRGVALGAAEHRAESGDAARIHQRGIGWAQLLGEDHSAFGQSLQRLAK